MGRISGRDADQTRRQVLDAAASLIGERGLGASLDEIARRAGVSKGGLKYHFASKDALLQALTEDIVTSFQQEVTSEQEHDDASPGRLVRAYVRCVLKPDVDAAQTIERHALMARLVTVEALQEIYRADSSWWGAALAADGLDPTLTDVIVSAADGVASAPLWGELYDEARLAAVRDRLLAMTREAPAGA